MVNIFPSAEKLKIEIVQQRIEIMVRTKNEIKKNIHPLLISRNDESANIRYNELYAQMDRVIAEDAKFLVETLERKQPKT